MKIILETVHYTMNISVSLCAFSNVFFFSFNTNTKINQCCMLDNIVAPCKISYTHNFSMGFKSTNSLSRTFRPVRYVFYGVTDPEILALGWEVSDVFGRMGNRYTDGRCSQPPKIYFLCWKNTPGGFFC